MTEQTQTQTNNVTSIKAATPKLNVSLKTIVEKGDENDEKFILKLSRFIKAAEKLAKYAGSKDARNAERRTKLDKQIKTLKERQEKLVEKLTKKSADLKNVS